MTAPALDDLVPFDLIVPADALSALDLHLGIANEALERFLAHPPVTALDAASFVDGLMHGVDLVVVLAEHFDETTGDPAWRAAYETAFSRRDIFRSALFASSALHAVLSTLARGASGEEERVLSQTLRALRKGGATSLPEARERLRMIDGELVERTLLFARNVDQAMRDDPGAFPSVANEVLASAEDRDLRKRVWHAQHAVAAAANGELVREILRLRDQRAALLGYASAADMILDGQMKSTGHEALGFLRGLTDRLQGAFARETASLAQLAARRGVGALEPWDIAFYAELQRRESCAFDAAAMRPYLPYPAVLQAIQELTTQLFGVRWEAVASAAAPTWHPSVSTWRLFSGTDALAVVYIDAFARDGKREGAWMTGLTTCLPGSGPGVVIVATDIAGPAEGTGETPCLTTSEVVRLLHEMGHAMHHVLCRARFATLSGTRVPRDFVELPSTLLEGMLSNRDFVRRMARHVVTSEPLPEVMLEAFLAARQHRAASRMMQRIGLAVVDLELHSAPLAADPMRAASTILQRYAPAALPDGHARIASLTHVFGSTEGYESALYAYVWAEVLAADAGTRLVGSWDSLRDEGRALQRAVFSRGNTADAAVQWHELMGREPDTNQLLAMAGGDQRP